MLEKFLKIIAKELAKGNKILGIINKGSWLYDNCHDFRECSNTEMNLGEFEIIAKENNKTALIFESSKESIIVYYDDNDKIKHTILLKDLF